MEWCNNQTSVKQIKIYFPLMRALHTLGILSTSFMRNVFPTVLKEFPHMLSTCWLIFLHSAVQLIPNHLNWVAVRWLWRPGHLMQHQHKSVCMFVCLFCVLFRYACMCCAYVVFELYWPNLTLIDLHTKQSPLPLFRTVFLYELIKVNLMQLQGLWSNTNIGTDTCIHTHDNIRTIHTRRYVFWVVDMC
jgi:hypothetical protein